MNSRRMHSTPIESRQAIDFDIMFVAVRLFAANEIDEANFIFPSMPFAPIF